MKLLNLINIITERLPQLTDLFSDTLSVDTIVQTGGTVTVTTTSSHGLTTGDRIVMSGAKSGVEIDIPSSQIIDNTVIFKTIQKHNIVSGFNFIEFSPSPTVVEIQGTDAFYNGIQTVVDPVPNKNTFSVEFESTPPPITTGTPVAFAGAEKGYNGTHNITVISSTGFTFPIEGDPLSPFNIPEITVHTNFRISATLTLERAVGSYTEQNMNKYWLFVASTADTASKDRNVNSDAVTERYNGVSFRFRILSDFSLFIIAPTSNEIAARVTHDILQDLRDKLFTILCGVPTFTENASQDFFQINFVGSSLSVYNTAFVVQEYAWQGLYDITYRDIWKNNVFASAKMVSLSINDTLTASAQLNEDGSI